MELNHLQIKSELEHIKETHDYCEHCGIVYEHNKDNVCCPYCIQDEEMTWDEQQLEVLTTQRNKLNRKISTLKKANLEQ